MSTERPTTVRALLAWATARRIARLDAEVLLAAALACTRSRIHAWPDHVPDPSARRRFLALAQRRAAGEPLAYLTGIREFWSLALQVSPATLVPRPETELLVELALARLPDAAAADVADLGTGSGAIALALASERPRWRLVATDRSRAALAVAQSNARALRLDNVAFRQGDWYAPLGGERFDLIVANPPYVAADDPHLQSAGLRHEPRDALTPGPDGLTALRSIIAGAGVHLKPGGWLILEHGHDQGEAVCALLADAGFGEVAGVPDFAGCARAAVGRAGRCADPRSKL